MDGVTNLPPAAKSGLPEEMVERACAAWWAKRAEMCRVEDAWRDQMVDAELAEIHRQSMRAAIAALAPWLTDEGWREIESAPRDGTLVDLYSMPDACRYPDAQWRGTTKLRRGEAHRWIGQNQDYDGGEGLIPSFITHWRPLPASPHAGIDAMKQGDGG